VTRFEVLFVRLANVLVGGTGLVYGWLRYLAAPDDEFSVAHPWQAAAQHLHVLAAPLLVFAVGLVWRGHVWLGYRLGNGVRRPSGILLAGLAAPMIVSGYLIQVAVEPAWRTAWVALHLATSALWLVGALAHQIGRRPRS